MRKESNTHGCRQRSDNKQAPIWGLRYHLARRLVKRKPVTVQTCDCDMDRRIRAPASGAVKLTSGLTSGLGSQKEGCYKSRRGAERGPWNSTAGLRFPRESKINRNLTH